MPTENQPTFLYELLNKETLDVTACDVTHFLSNALDAVLVYLKGFEDERFSPEVAVDENGKLEGIAFFDSQDRARAFVTVYHLEHDVVENEFVEITRIAALPSTELEEALSQLLG